jgi:hypothetical protein
VQPATTETAPLVGKLAQAGAQLHLRRSPGLVVNALAIRFDDTARPPLSGRLLRMLGSCSASASVGHVPSLAWIGRRCATRPGVVMMATCGRGYGRSRPSVGALATVGLGSCWPARGWS